MEITQVNIAGFECLIAGEGYPVVFLHGIGPTSNGINQLYKEGPLVKVVAGHIVPVKFIVPHSKTEWNADALLPLITSLNKPFLIGHSMGGAGVVNYVKKYADSVLGAFEISMASAPGGEENITCPFWAAHGDKDPVGGCNVNNSRNLVAKMQAAGLSPTYYEYAGSGHFIDQWFYTTPGEPGGGFYYKGKYINLYNDIILPLSNTSPQPMPPAEKGIFINNQKIADGLPISVTIGNYSLTIEQK